VEQETKAGLSFWWFVFVSTLASLFVCVAVVCADCYGCALHSLAENTSQVK